MLSIFFACENYESKIFDNGVSFELAQLREKQLKDVEYTIEFDIPEIVNKPVLGKENISFYYTACNEAPLLIDFRNPKEHIKSVTLNGKKTKLTFYNEHIIIKSKKLIKGENIINIEFIAGNRALNRNSEYLYTLFVPDRACTAFPCFDQPSLKANFRTKIKVPKDWIAIANSELINKTETNSGKLYDFDFTKDISTYLYSFVAGKFESVTKSYDDLNITMYHREEDKEKLAKNTDKIFELKYSSLKWLENYTQINYPFKKLDFIVIPSFQYSGMEHPGAILYHDSKIFLDESATIRDKLDRANLIAHETAHMWFGDLVTMQWFSEVWLKEVFANFMAGKIVNPQFPNINHELNFLINHFPASYSVDRTRGANPIEQDLDNMKNAGTLYGSIIYHKAPIVMSHLENMIGNDILQDGLQEYLANYSYSNATWDDLIEILNAKTPVNLTKWSKAWVYEAGMPNYIIERAHNVNGSFVSVIVEQTDPKNEGRQWKQNSKFLLSDNQKQKTYTLALKDTFNVIDLLETYPDPNCIFPNPDGTAYGYFRLDSISTNHILDKLIKIDDPVLRCSMYISLWENMLNSNIKPMNVFNSFTSALHNENNAQNINLLCGYIKELYWRFLTTQEKNKVSAKLEQLLLKEIILRLSTSEKSSLFKAYCNVVTNEKELNNLYKIWDSQTNSLGIDFSENDYSSIALELILKNKIKYESIIQEQLKRISNDEKQKRFKFIAEAILNPDSFFESLKNEENREKEPWVIDGLYYLHHSLNAKNSVKYIYPSLNMLEELQITGDIFFPKRWLDATFSGHASIDAVTEINLFLNEHPNFPEKLKNKIFQSTDLVFKASLIRNE